MAGASCSPLPQDQTFPLLSTADVWFVPPRRPRNPRLQLSGVSSRYRFMSRQRLLEVVAQLAVRALSPQVRQTLADVDARRRRSL